MFHVVSLLIRSIQTKGFESSSIAAVDAAVMNEEILGAYSRRIKTIDVPPFGIITTKTPFSRDVDKEKSKG